MIELTIWMSHDLRDLRLPSSSDLSVETFDEVDPTTPQLPSPALIPDAVVPELLAREG